METDPSSSSRLGRGLSSMVNEVSTIKAGSTANSGGYLRIPIAQIREVRTGRPSDQTLIESVKKIGVLQPVLVSRGENGYDLLAGSRRLHASREAGLSDVPALIIPPGRAGALDVFLEENLSRQELSETERMRLRDQWTRETGRDEDQARLRIPEIAAQHAGTSTTSGTSSSRIWMTATGVLSFVCAALILFNLKSKSTDNKSEVYPIAFVEHQADEPAVINSDWMNSFVFPGNIREINEGRLKLAFSSPIFEQGQISARGKLYLNQLAAVLLASDVSLHVNVIAQNSDQHAGQLQGAFALDHLVTEGVPPKQLLLRTAPADGNTSDLRVEVYPAKLDK